jgi:hypothetical protein
MSIVEKVNKMSPEELMDMAAALKIAASERLQQNRNETIGKSAEVVVNGLKKIKSDLEARFDELNGTIQSKANSLSNGKDGKDGRNGKDGQDGRIGVDGTQGPQGLPGQDGEDGEDGVSVVNAFVDFDGGLTIVLSDGREINAGEVIPMDVAEKIKVITNGGGTSQSVLDSIASLQSQIDTLIPSQTGNSGKFLTTNGTATSWATVSGSGTVTSVSVTSANGFSGTVANATITPAISIGTSVTGVLKGNGAAISAATAGTDYQAPITLTTTGTSGAATFSGNTLNIPQYSGGGGSGTVTSVAATVPAFLSVTGSPITTSGTLAIGLSGTALPIANGGTGATTRQDAIDALAGAVTSGSYLRGNGADVVMAAIQSADVPTLNQNTTGSAATLTTGRTIAITGDLAYTSPSFDGSTNVTAAGTLATVNANVGAFTNASVTVNAKGLVTAASSGTAPVTSVTGTSPVTSSGGATPAISLAASYGDTQNPYASKTANFMLAAPNGTAGVPTFRAVVATDIPTLNQNTTGTAANVTGTVAITNGGTGETTRQAAIDALAGATTSGSYLRGNGTDVVMATIQAADVPTLNQNTTGTASNVTGTVAIANGGSGQTTASAAFNALSPITTTGDLILGNGINSAARLGIGANGYVLTSNGTTASWAAGGSSGTVTSVAASVPSFLSITGSPITTSGTLAISYSGTALPIANGGTGATTAQTAINALVGTVTNRYFLRGNNTNAVMAMIQAADVPTLNQDTTGTAANVTGTVAIANGGTALTTTPTNGQLLIGNGTGYTLSTLTAGSNITITNASGGITIASTGGSGITTGKSIAMAMIFGY